MKDIPLLMKGELVRATLENRKNKTRRLDGLEEINAGYYKDRISKVEMRDGVWCFWEIGHGSSALPVFTVTPRYVVRRKIWVREAFLTRCNGEKVIYRADLDPVEAAGIGGMYGGWKPSIHMARKYSRITLEIIGVRCERLQSISEEDAKAEGVTIRTDAGIAAEVLKAKGDSTWGPAKLEFWHLWESINGAGSWEKSPWVWVISFKRVQPIPADLMRREFPV